MKIQILGRNSKIWDFLAKNNNIVLENQFKEMLRPKSDENLRQILNSFVTSYTQSYDLFYIT